jgi:hypothetical protein
VVAALSNHDHRAHAESWLLRAATTAPGFDSSVVNAGHRTPSGLEDSATSPVGNGGGEEGSTAEPTYAGVPISLVRSPGSWPSTSERIARYRTDEALA